ncbi:hypothetical protein DPMN_108532 [Dreissena polymorpha]|uniref:Coiled-coil domain-containing protein 158 n=1 Tax=Dreissena polymorpha TaxID=45954 RepID=A0A9D4QM57_DREPO|nr:hypothetical protein DPMN_108532 [Dreissena polymorpha]
MASSAGFSIATSPPGAIGGGLSPLKAGKASTIRKAPTAAQLLEQIRHLEAEGNKLRSDTLGIGAPTMFNALTDLNMSSSAEKSELPKFSSTSPSTLSALVDYSSEQKTISDLRIQLEQQRKETERLTSHFHTDGFSTSTSRAGTILHLPISPSKTGFSTLPSTELFSSRRPASVTGATGAMEIGPPSHLEKVLKDSQEQVADLRRRLMEANEQSESQKRQFRLTVEDLKAKLHDTTSSRDSALEQRQKECTQLEMRIAELNATVKELQNKLRVQEQLEREVQDLKQAQSTDQHSLSFEYKQKEDETLSLCKRITQMTADHERQMTTINERANNARKQAASLESQLSNIQGQHQQQLKLKEETVTDLENKIRHLREELHEERDKYSSKRESLEHKLSETEKEMSKLRTERDEAIRNHSNMESKVADLQLTINRLTKDISSEKESSGKFWEREGELRAKQAQLEARLEEKTRDVDRLEKMLASVKQECSATVSEKVSMIEKQERERHMEKIGSLTQQLSEVSQKCNRISLELETTKAEQKDLKHQTRESSDRADTLKVQYEATIAERKHLTDMLTAKSSDFDRVTQERDYYFNIMEQKNSELGQLKMTRERLTIQIEEKEKSSTALQEQLTSLQQMFEANARNADNLQEERDVLVHQLQEMTSALEELRATKDTMAKKMKIREKRVRELEMERQKMVGEVDLKGQEMAIIQQEKETLFKELKDSRYEVSSLTEERDSLKKELESQKYQLERTISKLQYRLKSTEQDLGMAQKALRKREAVDNSAVKIADKMQKEVTAKRSLIDTMQSKIRWYQEQLDNVLKEKGSVEGDKEKLKTSLNKALVQNQQLSVDLETSNARCLELKNHANKLEASLEKAAVRNATTQAQIEMFEQELTRMKLAHQLEVKEAVQKATSQLKDTKDSQFSDKLGTNQPHSKSSNDLPQTNNVRPEQMAQEDRLLAQKSSENYKEIGSELKLLLKEMRCLISDQQTSPREAMETNRRPQRSNESRSRNKAKPLQPVNELKHFPVFQKKKAAFSHYRVPPAPSDISCYSDEEVDEHNKEKIRQSDRNGKHRRSKSAEALSSLGGDSSQWSDYKTSDISPPTDRTEEVSRTGGTLPDTQELCRRLEERLSSLTKMGDNLQKENREMADLMKMQGQKLKKVKDTEKKMSIRKKTR